MRYNWVVFTKRTEDPKLSFIESLLSRDGIPHKRDGESFHAPIMLVPDSFIDSANRILGRPARKFWHLPVRNGVSLDDVPDDHPCFYAGGKRPGRMFDECPAHWVYQPHDFIPTCDESDPCDGEDLCKECLEVWEDPCDYHGMGWVGRDGQP